MKKTKKPEKEEQRIAPQAGPQEAFCSSPADITIYGGAAGGGKSYGLLLEAARNVHVPGYSGVVFRRTNPELVGGGSIWEKSSLIYPHLGGVPREGASLDWTFPTPIKKQPAIIEFRHMQHEKDKTNHQGKEYAYIGFDELTTFTSGQFWYLFGRNRSTCGVKPYIRATCNPDPDSFVRVLIDWWIGADGFPVMSRSGVIRYFVRVEEELVWADDAATLKKMHPRLDPVSFTFIAAKLEDNPALISEDPAYEGKLMALPSVDRQRLLYGNWNVRPAAGKYFRQSMFQFIDERPKDVLFRVRAWDLAASEPTDSYPDPDWTIGLLMSVTTDGIITFEHMEYMRKGPHDVEKSVMNMADADGKKVQICFWQDPGQAGKSQVAYFARKLMGYVVVLEKAAEDKITYAKPVSSSAQAGNCRVVKGHWNEKFFAQMEAFPALNELGNPIRGIHDDVPDAASLGHLVLSKPDLAILRAMGKR